MLDNWKANRLQKQIEGTATCIGAFKLILKCAAELLCDSILWFDLRWLMCACLQLTALTFKLAKDSQAAKNAFVQAAIGQMKQSAYPHSLRIWV